MAWLRIVIFMEDSSDWFNVKKNISGVLMMGTWKMLWLMVKVGKNGNNRDDGQLWWRPEEVEGLVLIVSGMEKEYGVERESISWTIELEICGIII